MLILRVKDYFLIDIKFPYSFHKKFGICVGYYLKSVRSTNCVDVCSYNTLCGLTSLKTRTLDKLSNPTIY